MRMTPAEFELLAACRRGPTATPTPSAGARRPHLRRRPGRRLPQGLRRGQGHALDDLQRGWGSAQAGHLKADLRRSRQAGGFGINYFEGLLGVGALHSKINLPLKWFLGTYPVFLDLVHEAMRADAPEPARIDKKRFGRSVRERRLRRLHRRRARDQPRLQLRLAGDRRGLLLRHVHVDGREPAHHRRGRPGPRHLRPLRRRAQHDARDAAELQRLHVRGAGHVLLDEHPLSETGQAVNELAVSASASPKAPRARPTSPSRAAPPSSRLPPPQRRRRALPHRHRGRRSAPPPRSTTPAPASRTPRPRSPRSPPARSRSAASSRPSTTSPARPTCSRSTPRSRPPAPVSPAVASPSSPTRSASWPSAPPVPPPTPAT